MNRQAQPLRHSSGNFTVNYRVEFCQAVATAGENQIFRPFHIDLHEIKPGQLFAFHDAVQRLRLNEGAKNFPVFRSRARKKFLAHLAAQMP